MKPSLIIIIASIITEGTATVVANYDFSNSGTPTDLPNTFAEPLTSDPNITASSFSNGPGFTGSVVVAPGISTGSDSLGNTGYGTGNGFLYANRGSGVNTNGTEAEAFTDGEYFEVTITPETNYEINFTTLSFYSWVNNKNRGADQFTVTSSIDGHSLLNAIGVGEISPNSSGVTANNALSYNINLSAPQFQNIDTSTTFRIYVWSGGSTTSSSLVGFDNLVFDGDVSIIPEPSTTIILGAGLGALVMRRRRSSTEFTR